MSAIKKTAAGAVLAGAMVFGAGVAPANALLDDNRVDIEIGDITVLEDVRVNAAANIVAALCGIPVAVGVISDIDQGNRSNFECTARTGTGPIIVTDN